MTDVRQEYNRDQSIISDRVRSLLREVLIDDIANIVYEYIFASEPIDWEHDTLFDVWYQGQWTEARIIRPGSYPVYDKDVRFAAEFARQFVELDSSPSRYDFDEIMRKKFIPDRVAAYQSHTLYPHSHYYSMDELARASDEKRLYVGDEDMNYLGAVIVKKESDKCVWIHYRGCSETWDECIPIRSYRLYVANSRKLPLYMFKEGCVSLGSWRYKLSHSIKCYHHYQMLTFDLLVSHDFDEDRVRAALAQHVCQLVVP
jgi:hypothetical protein